MEDYLNKDWSKEEVKENQFMREKRLTDEELEKKWKFAKQLNSQLEEDVMGLNEDKKKEQKAEKEWKKQEELELKKKEQEEIKVWTQAQKLITD